MYKYWLELSELLSDVAGEGVRCLTDTYLLCQLKRQNLPVECLDRIFDAIVISKLMYASPSWFGYISVEQLNIIKKLFVKAHTLGLTKKFVQR